MRGIVGAVGVGWSLSGSIVLSMVVGVEFRSDDGSMLNFSGVVSAGVALCWVVGGGIVVVAVTTVAL